MAKSRAQSPDSVRVFIDSALQVMQNMSINSKQVNWQQVEDSVHKLTMHSQTYESAFPAIQYAFNQLKDKHGWLVFNGSDYRNPAFTPDTSRITENIKQAASYGPRIYAATLERHYAYLSIPFYGGQDPVKMKLFAQKIQDSLCRHINTATRGMIIDLRLNAGGNIYPMIAGIANVLGPGTTGYAVGKNDKLQQPTRIEQGGIKLGEHIFRIDSTCGDLSKLPVAVIIGPVTGSSGEFLAMSFVGRPNTILVGEATAGYVTANEGRLLPGNDNGIVLAVEYAADRNGKIYRDHITPDITIKGGDDFFNHARDRKLLVAMRWLKNQPVQ